MTPQPKKDGMIEDLITLGHKGSSNGLRHFVAGKPIQAGSYMEVKFGGRLDTREIRVIILECDYVIVGG
ncbi:hypothetical protein G9G63_00035 [Paenibacillus sp. EKM202P]|uniref:hypothetical protein n=1 Tax=unclassified Paenibacillus TaxID=185978 RepID=UPI0013EAE9EF|nr:MULTISPECIES: hypothetical protein [unclassified Paenibacillus]KAF6568250.1 hypothetical protein G9G63_00035 [Paenibacillus sp. EKM202P]KAF6570650.1 hypothetical protein G9G64_07950 [Paenibacillus sp. EKM207P]